MTCKRILVAPAQVHPTDLVHTNEELQQRALKNHYDNLKKRENAKREEKIRKWKRFSIVTNPIICIAFVIGYWTLGLREYFKDLD